MVDLIIVNLPIILPFNLNSNPMKKTIILSFALLSIISCSSSDDSGTNVVVTPPSSGAVVQPRTGGSTLPNQVYIDLSTIVQTEVIRTSWDLGFYSGTDFRVILNGSINKMAAKQLNTTNIDEVQIADETVTTGNFQDPNSGKYIDQPSGDINGTLIAPISVNDADNKVYLVNLGQEISDTPAEAFKVNMTGKSRGWKKIRILRSGNDYKLQYADLEATTHQEVIISKAATFNFSFFSFKTNTTVSVEPQKEKWDLNFTTFTNLIPYPGQEYTISYFYPEFAIINSRAGVTAYQVLIAEGGSFDAFALANVDKARFETAEAKDQRAIGPNWRVTTTNPPSVYDDRFFVLKDAEGNIYKIKFISFYTPAGERGNVTFQYELLK